MFKNEARQHLYYSLFCVITICDLFTSFVCIADTSGRTIVNLLIAGLFALVYTLFFPLCRKRRQNFSYLTWIEWASVFVLLLIVEPVITDNLSSNFILKSNILSFMINSKAAFMCPILLIESIVYFVLYIRMKRGRKGAVCGDSKIE